MLSFKEFLKEAYSPEEGRRLVKKSAAEEYITVKGITALISPHANLRQVERSIGSDVIKELITKSLEYVSEKPAEAGKSNEVLYYSTKLKQGVIASYRRDLGGNPSDKTKYFFIVTILPPGKNKATTGTHKVTLKESLEKFGHEVVFID